MQGHILYVMKWVLTWFSALLMNQFIYTTPSIHSTSYRKYAAKLVQIVSKFSTSGDSFVRMTGLKSRRRRHQFHRNVEMDPHSRYCNVFWNTWVTVEHNRRTDWMISNHERVRSKLANSPSDLIIFMTILPNRKPRIWPFEWSTHT